MFTDEDKQVKNLIYQGFCHIFCQTMNVISYEIKSV